MLTIYKSFIRPHLDYGDIRYDQVYNVSFCQKLESLQHKSLIAITGAIKRTSTEKLFNELGLETLKKEDGTGNYVASIKFIKINLQNNYLTLFPLPQVHMTQQILTIFLNSEQSKLFLKLLSLSGHRME